MKAYILCRGKFGENSAVAVANSMKNKTEVATRWSVPDNQDILAIRWGCTATVPQKKVVNKASAIHRVFNKADFRKELSEEGLAPKFYGGSFIKEEQLPVIVRPLHHTQGSYTFLCNTMQEFYEAVHKCHDVEGGYYISEYIQKAKEFRVFVVSGRVVFISEKFPNKKTDIAWDISVNSQWANVKWGAWNKAVLDVATKTMQKSGLTFGGVDVIVSQDGSVYALEVNSAAGLYGDYMVSCVAKAFDYIVENDKKDIPLGTKETDWTYLNYIHPAIEEKAYV